MRPRSDQAQGLRVDRACLDTGTAFGPHPGDAGFSKQSNPAQGPGRRIRDRQCRFPACGCTGKALALVTGSLVWNEHRRARQDSGSIIEMVDCIVWTCLRTSAATRAFDQERSFGTRTGRATTWRKPAIDSLASDLRGRLEPLSKQSAYQGSARDRLRRHMRPILMFMSRWVSESPPMEIMTITTSSGIRLRRAASRSGKRP